MKNKICCVIYTNTKCSDVWEMFINEQLNHFNVPLYFISDKEIPNIDIKTFLYENGEDYYYSWNKSLSHIDYDYFIYLQEDFILYDKVDIEMIDAYIQFLKENEEYSFIRLIKSGSVNSNKITNTLYEIESTNRDIFSMQPTIWRKGDYMKIMDGTKNKIWLENETYRDFMIQNNIKGLYHYDNEKKRGLNHYDTLVYPYVATALVRGKWNMSEYGNELSRLTEKYKININNRGIF
jgi:hypothetical protein